MVEVEFVDRVTGVVSLVMTIFCFHRFDIEDGDF
jgi:hypothetical protein